MGCLRDRALPERWGPNRRGLRLKVRSVVGSRQVDGSPGEAPRPGTAVVRCGKIDREGRDRPTTSPQAADRAGRPLGPARRAVSPQGALLFLISFLKYILFCIYLAELCSTWGSGSLTRDQTRTSRTGARSLKPWTTREVPQGTPLNGPNGSCPRPSAAGQRCPRRVPGTDTRVHDDSWR